MSETSQKWCHFKIKNAPLELTLSKTLNRGITDPYLEQQGKSLCTGSGAIRHGFKNGNYSVHLISKS